MEGEPRSVFRADVQSLLEGLSVYSTYLYTIHPDRPSKDLGNGVNLGKDADGTADSLCSRPAARIVKKLLTGSERTPFR